MIPLPAWLPEEAWAAYLEMRKKCKKPATAWAERLALSELFKIKAAGHDPMDSLNQSILRCWTDFYPPKEKQIDPAASSDYEKTKARNKAEAARTPEKQELAENARKARERAGLRPVQRTLQ